MNGPAHVCVVYPYTYVCSLSLNVWLVKRVLHASVLGELSGLLYFCCRVPEKNSHTCYKLFAYCRDARCTIYTSYNHRCELELLGALHRANYSSLYMKL